MSSPTEIIQAMYDAFGRGDVGQLGSAGDDVADGVDAGFAGLLIGADFDESAVRLHAGHVFQADLIGVRLAPNGDENFIDEQWFHFAIRQRHVQRNARARALNVTGLGAGFAADSSFAETAFQFR